MLSVPGMIVAWYSYEPLLEAWIVKLLIIDPWVFSNGQSEMIAMNEFRKAGHNFWIVAVLILYASRNSISSFLKA